MTREEIVAMFRRECPEITDRVVKDPVLHDWLLIGDKNFCTRTRCIVTDFTFNSVVSTSVYATKYDLTAQESKFYDIDDCPGGGVSFDDEPLDETSPAELDENNDGWRTSSAGVPEAYYRRGKWIYFDKPVETAGKVIRVYASLISDDFDDDSKTPFNQLTYLENFHSALIMYLKWRSKRNKQEAREALSDYVDYCNWAKKEISGGKNRPVTFQPVTNMYNPSN